MTNDSDTPDVFRNIRVYWLTFVAYWGILLIGYDTGIGGGVVNNAYFQTYFGMIENGKRNIPKSNAISSIVVSVLQAGAFFGALGSAPVSEKIGRKSTLFSFTTVFAVGAILTAVAEGPNGLAIIYSGRVISGIGIGGISAVAPAYVSECSPKEVRGRMTGLNQMMVSVGTTLSYFVNFGVGLHIQNGVNVWRIPFGIQLIPAGIMCLGLLSVKESPRWLSSVGRHNEAIRNLAYFRRASVDSPAVISEMVEINAAILEEREARKGLGLKKAFFGKGNFIRFWIAFYVFLIQQWSGQNSVTYYAPQFFTAIGYTGTTSSLLASAVYGIVKLVSTILFTSILVETLGRRYTLFICTIGMGTPLYIVGAVLKTHPPTGSQLSPASKAMAAMLYINAAFYSTGWGPLPWVYVADIFPTRTRHYGVAVASASLWMWSFVVSKVTPQMITNLGYKIFLVFGTVNIGAMATFSLLIPETKGKSLEEMDILFGAVSEGDRLRYIERQKELDKTFLNEEV